MTENKLIINILKNYISLCRPGIFSYFNTGSSYDKVALSICQQPFARLDARSARGEADGGRAGGAGRGRARGEALPGRPASVAACSGTDARVATDTSAPRT